MTRRKERVLAMTGKEGRPRNDKGGKGLAMTKGIHNDDWERYASHNNLQRVEILKITQEEGDASPP